MLKSSLLFKKIQNSRVNNSRHFGIKDAKLLVYGFLRAQTYIESFKSALVYL